MSKDTKLIAELDFLTALERGEVITQMSLKQRIGVSVRLINALLKRAVNKGYVKIRRAPYKRYAYYLTPQGFTEKGRLVAAYLENSLHFLRQARTEYTEIFDCERAKGQRRFILASGGELVEIAILAALGRNLELTIYAPDCALAQISGIPVSRELSPDDATIVLADSVSPQSCYERLVQQYSAAQIRTPPFLRVTPDRVTLLAEAAQINDAA